MKYVYVLTKQYDEKPYGIFASLEGAQDAADADKYKGFYWQKHKGTNLWEGRVGTAVWHIRKVGLGP